jgi:hypothetical protein
MNEIKKTAKGRKVFSGSPAILENQKGTVVVLVAVSLIAFLAFTALAVDIGRYMVTRNELQNIADSAALAACRVLGNIYQNLPIEDQVTYVCDDPATILETAVTVGSSNRAGGLDDIVILSEDVIIGTWDGTALTQTLAQPDAVKVIARRDGNANNPITTIFAKIIGINTLDVWMDATAALTGQSTTEPGELELPIGISSYFFQDGNACNDSIVFNPTNDPDSCAGWNSYNISPPNDNLLRNILNGDHESPATTAEETPFNFIGGNLSNPTFEALLLLFKRKGYDTKADGETPVAYVDSVDDDGDVIQIPKPGSLSADDGAVVPIAEDGDPLYVDGEIRLDENEVPLEQAEYPDGTPRNMHRWETTVVVYDSVSCDNPNTSITIKGYTKIVMTDVKTAPEQRIEGKIMCDLYSEFDTRGGGGEFGVKGTIPGLVE